MLSALVLSACGQSARHDFSDGRGDDASSGGSAGAQGGAGASFAGAGSSGRGAAGGGGISIGGGGAGGVSGAGAGGVSGAGGSSVTVDVSGSWAMFGFGDPVAVSLQQSGTELSGTGCCAGLPADNDVPICCAAIAGGSIRGQNAEFAFPVDLGPGIYAANVFVSSDGSRMAGPFHHLGGWGRPTAWVRIASDQIWLPPSNGNLFDLVEPRVGTFELALNGAGSVAGFSPGVSYMLGLTVAARRALVHGDLGAFWDGELSWSDADETLRAGPVPETHPELPIELALRFEDTSLREVVATFPSGDTASFTVRAAM
jgi:hypothetical protein